MTTDTPITTGAGRPAISAGRRRTVEFILDHLVWIILVIVLAIFSIGIKNFMQVGIFLNILQQGAFIGIMAVGLSLVIITGHIDLSVESVMALSAMVTALAFGTHGAGIGIELSPSWLVIPVTLTLTLLIGAAIGAINAWFVIVLRINAFIVTLASFIFVRGVVVAVSGGRSVYGLPDELRFLAAGSLLGVPILGWLLILVFVVFSFVLVRTRFGRHVIMIGGNPVATFRAGIAVDRLVAWTFIISGALAAFAGWLLAARTAGATANLGVGTLFEAFAAVVIGGVSLKGGAGRLSGVFAGVLLLSAIQTATNVMGMPPHYTQMIRGALVLLAVLLDTVKTQIRRRWL